MKQTLLVISFMFTVIFCAQAQNNVTYTIGKTNKYTVANLEAGLQKCILDQYRRQDRRVTMTFDDSTKVVLFSADELKAKGLPVRESIIDRDPDIDLESIFILTNDGMILQQVRKMPDLNDQKKYIGRQKEEGK
jgi:hypothetical protein